MRAMNHRKCTLSSSFGFAHRFAWLPLVLLTLVACVGGRRGGGGGGADTREPRDSGARRDGGVVTADAGSTNNGNGYPTCDVGDDCPTWFCECAEGPPVNTRHCTNDVCEDAPQACPRACANFGTCWLGIASGGFDEGSNSGVSTCTTEPDPDDVGGCADGATFNDVGKPCTSGHACESRLCFGRTANAICTKRCEIADDCPAGWHCIDTSDGYQVCMIGGEPDGHASTNDACDAVTYTDVGDYCTSAGACQSGICLTGNYCSARCSSERDCPSSWSCVLSSGDGIRYCVR